MQLNMTFIRWGTALLSILAHMVNVILFRIKVEENVKKIKRRKNAKTGKHAFLSMDDHSHNSSRREK
jgi:hypothetical protein